MTPRPNSFAHSFIHMSRRAKQKRHMQFIYCHSLDTPTTPNTSGGRPRRWAGQRQLKRCRWRLIGFMPHLCVGANSWNCAAARLASPRLELVLKISSVMSVTWNRGQRQLGATLRGRGSHKLYASADSPRLEQLQVVAIVGTHNFRGL